MSERKYYWLKLKKDFFKRHDIQIIESMPNGRDYVLLYLKLLVESVDQEGGLRFNETIPYNESMLATITNTNIDTVGNAMKLFKELGMVEILDDQTIYMNEVSKLLGAETYWAQKKREQRNQIKDSNSLNIGHCPTVVQTRSKESKQEKELEKELESETKRELELEKKSNVVCQKVSLPQSDVVDETIQYLNARTGKNFRVTTKEYRRFINARIKQGATLEQIKYVIDVKCAEWLHSEEMRQHLNPKTLFREANFDKYLNQIMPQPKRTLKGLVATGHIDLSDVL